jgi:hypothetical protein
MCAVHVQAAWSDIQARYCQSTAAAQYRDSWTGTLPEHSTATYAQLMLLHGAGWPNHNIWQHWQDAHPPGSLAMFVHMKVTPQCDVPGNSSRSRYLLCNVIGKSCNDCRCELVQMHMMKRHSLRGPQPKAATCFAEQQLGGT